MDKKWGFILKFWFVINSVDDNFSLIYVYYKKLDFWCFRIVVVEKKKIFIPLPQMVRVIKKSPVPFGTLVCACVLVVLVSYLDFSIIYNVGAFICSRHFLIKIRFHLRPVTRIRVPTRLVCLRLQRCNSLGGIRTSRRIRNSRRRPIRIRSTITNSHRGRQMCFLVRMRSPFSFRTCS